MNEGASEKPVNLLQLLPSVDELLRSSSAQKIGQTDGAGYATRLARTVLSNARESLSNEADDVHTRESLTAELAQEMERTWLREQRSGIRRVINATGVVIHTNLGRAPLSDVAKKAIVDGASGYCTLEYDLETGKRGSRGGRAERLLAELTGAEAALIVNNGAAAAYLVLSELAAGGEAIISRGELVEIGGDFRVPDVLERSGAVLKEVGTTNRTKIKDYENAISENTKVILKVHPSNYRIIGFTAAPSLKELADLAHAKGLMLYEDAGSGALIDLSRYGLGDEPLISRSIAAGADVVTFSGDKLLGATQSGLIVGRKDMIDRLRKNPLYRVLRADKLVYAALEATLETYRRETAIKEVPVLKMLTISKDEIRARAEAFVNKLGNNVKAEIIHGHSAIGGGAAPDVQPETILIAVQIPGLSADELEKKLRSSDPPVVTRKEFDRVVFDLRTVREDEESDLLKVFSEIDERLK